MLTHDRTNPLLFKCSLALFILLPESNQWQQKCQSTLLSVEWMALAWPIALSSHAYVRKRKHFTLLSCLSEMTKNNETENFEELICEKCRTEVSSQIISHTWMGEPVHFSSNRAAVASIFIVSNYLREFNSFFFSRHDTETRKLNANIAFITLAPFRKSIRNTLTISIESHYSCHLNPNIE